jgi:phosphotransferase system HPr-like phosphotransfer protein
VDSNGVSSDIYLQCSNYINNQSLQDLIINYKDKGSVADAASVIPIFLTTKENDLVVDISMKGNVAAAAAIMNRKFVGNAEKSKWVVKASKNLATVISKYNSEMTSRLFGNTTTKVAKVNSTKRQLVSQF